MWKEMIVVQISDWFNGAIDRALLDNKSGALPRN
jgi:hypothetical protein